MAVLRICNPDGSLTIWRMAPFSGQRPSTPHHALCVLVVLYIRRCFIDFSQLFGLLLPFPPGRPNFTFFRDTCPAQHIAKPIRLWYFCY